MGTRDRLMAGLARQLGRPDGWRGRLVARGLNRGNRGTVAAAVDACELGSGDHAADVGFGGGVGLGLLLDRVGPDGHVDGVDLSETMITTAKRRYSEECAAGSLTLRLGNLVDLPLPTGSLDGLITVNKTSSPPRGWQASTTYVTRESVPATTLTTC